jgi:hypothetical protein
MKLEVENSKLVHFRFNIRSSNLPTARRNTSDIEWKWRKLSRAQCELIAAIDIYPELSYNSANKQKSMQTALRLASKCTALEREATRMRKHAATPMPSLQTSNRVPSNANMSISTDPRTSSVASASVEHSDLNNTRCS